MSYAVQALVLLCLDQRQGEWVSIDDIAARIGIRVHATRLVCDELLQRGLIQFATRLGTPYFGVRCEWRTPGFSTGA